MGGIVARGENNNNEEEEESGYWSDLPCDLLDLISLRLYAGDSVMFRAVCKSWRSILPILDQPVPYTMQINNDLSLIKIDPQLRNIPCLMNFNSKTGLFHLHHPITNATYMVDLPELAEEEICFSKDGWFLVCHRPQSVFFFNPFTRTRIQVPPIPLRCGFQSMHFSCRPTLLGGCTVFGVFSDTYKEVSVGTFRLGRDRIWYFRFFRNNEDFLLSKCSPVLHNGLYYCLGRGGNLGIFNPIYNTWTVLGKPLNRLLECQQSFLLENDGDLFGVFVANDGRKIDVLRLEKSSDLTWHEVGSLEDKMFYVCYVSSYSNKATIRGTQNKIYFPKFYNDKNLFYSLGTRQYHSFLGNFSKRDVLDTKELKYGIWINMPMQEN